MITVPVVAGSSLPPLAVEVGPKFTTKKLYIHSFIFKNSALSE